MLRRALAHRPPQICLHAEHTGSDVELRLAYPASAQWACGDAANAATQAAADWVLIDTLAARWGHRGDNTWHTQWAILSGDPGAPIRHGTPSSPGTPWDRSSRGQEPVSGLCLWAGPGAAPFPAASGREDSE